MNSKKSETKSTRSNTNPALGHNGKHSPAEHQKYLADQKVNAKAGSEKTEKKNSVIKK